MFSNLRQGSQLYVFHKCASTPYIEMGSVEIQNQFGTFYQPIGIPMNLNIRIGDKVIPCPNLPPNAEIADVTSNTTGETITIACGKDALEGELRSLMQKSIDAVNSVEYHRKRIDVYKTLIEQLNPEQVAQAQRDKEMSEMRQQMAVMAQTIAQLNEKLSLRERENVTMGERTSSSKDKKGESK